MKKLSIILTLFLLAFVPNVDAAKAAYFFGPQENEHVRSYLYRVADPIFPGDLYPTQDTFSLSFDFRCPPIVEDPEEPDDWIYMVYTGINVGLGGSQYGYLGRVFAWGFGHGPIFSDDRYDDDQWHNLKYEMIANGTVRLTIDNVFIGSWYAPEYGVGGWPNNGSCIGGGNGSLYKGLLKNILLVVNGTTYLDMPLTEDLTNHAENGVSFTNENANMGGLVTLVDENITTYPANAGGYKWNGETCCHIYKNDGDENWTFLSVPTGGNIIAGDLTVYGYKRFRGCALIEFETPIPKGATLSSFVIGTDGAEVALGDWYGKLGIEMSNNPKLPATAEDFVSRAKSSYVVYDSDNEWMDDFKSAIQSLLSSDDVSSLLVFFEDDEGLSATNSAFGISSIMVVYRYTESGGGSVTRVVPWKLAN
jgi:hypothetical protein